jgi:hypothetical protein
MVYEVTDPVSEMLCPSLFFRIQNEEAVVVTNGPRNTLSDTVSYSLFWLLVNCQWLC